MAYSGELAEPGSMHLTRNAFLGVSQGVAITAINRLSNSFSMRYAEIAEAASCNGMHIMAVPSAIKTASGFRVSGQAKSPLVLIYNGSV